MCPSGAHYPISWKQFKKREACAAGECKDHTQLCIALIDGAVTRGIPEDFTLDCYCTSAKGLNHLQSTQRAYVGGLKLNRHVVLEWSVDWIVDKLTVEHWSIPEMKAVLAQHEAGSTLQNFS